MGGPIGSIQGFSSFESKSSVLKDDWVLILLFIMKETETLRGSESLRDAINLLSNHMGKDKVLYMKICSDEHIYAISECCDKILDNRFKFDQKQISKIQKKLKPIKADIRKLVRKSTCIKSRRKILQKPQVGEGVLDIISSLVIPTLLKLFV